MNTCNKNPPASSHPASLDSVSSEAWGWLLKDAEHFAAGQIQRYRWRGAKGGVLPGGFDANSIAAQAITELFEPSEDRSKETLVDETFLSEHSEDFLLSSPVQTKLPEA